jgi:hypothetical protein
MGKWLVLIFGVFLFFNGMTSRTYSFADPDRHCFNMDYIGIYGCFSSAAVTQIIVWGATLMGAAFVSWSFVRGRREKSLSLRSLAVESSTTTGHQVDDAKSTVDTPLPPQL